MPVARSVSVQCRHDRGLYVGRGSSQPRRVPIRGSSCHSSREESVSERCGHRPQPGRRTPSCRSNVSPPNNRSTSRGLVQRGSGKWPVASRQWLAMVRVVLPTSVCVSGSESRPESAFMIGKESGSVLRLGLLGQSRPVCRCLPIVKASLPVRSLGTTRLGGIVPDSSRRLPHRQEHIGCREARRSVAVVRRFSSTKDCMSGRQRTSRTGWPRGPAAVSGPYRSRLLGVSCVTCAADGTWRSSIATRQDRNGTVPARASTTRAAPSRPWR